MNILNRVTLRTLGENRVRTLVTIFGIILSAAMFTAVTTSVSSLQSFLKDVAIEQNGDWYGVAYGVNKSQIDGLIDDDRVDSLVSLQNIGYAALPNSQNEYKPYLFVGGMSDGFAEAMPVNLIEGRLPENTSEILLPKHLQTNGGVRYSIGESLSLEIGDRVSNGYSMNQNNAFLTGEYGDKEELVVNKQQTYTVVGFYERPGFEDYAAPGFTALTVADNADKDKYDVYIKTNNPGDIYGLLETEFPKNGIRTNNDLLRFCGASNDKRVNSVLYSLAAILMALIMFGSVSLIYNAFSISVSERTRQFGLLSSIGATKRQMLRGVLFEASFLSMIGIPIGILAGISGIGITLKLTRNLFQSFFVFSQHAVFDLSVSPGAIAAAVAIGLVTVLISAYIPARRAFRVSTIDAIRQANDIKTTARKVKTSKLTYKMFGFEGMLARKNFKRNRKKYKATVISLFLSVVLFISASSFCAYLSKSADLVVEKKDYDIVYSFTPDESSKTSLQELFTELSAVSGVTMSGYAYAQYETVEISDMLINKDYKEYISSKSGGGGSLPEAGKINAVMYFVADTLYKEFLDENSLDRDIYMSKPYPQAAVLDFVRIYDMEEGRYYTFNLMNSSAFDISYGRYKRIEGYDLLEITTDDDGIERCVYENEKGEQIKLTAEEARDNIILKAGTVIDSKPFCVDNNDGGITLIYPYSSMEDIIDRSSNDVSTVLYFKAADHKAVFDRIYKVLDEKALPTASLYDYAEAAMSRRALISVINIFSYGFIILISLIAAANVFNTISTNIGLRRHEFAMLKSIGLTRKGFSKMMNFECLLYGFKGLVYGIPVSFGVTYLIYRGVLNGLETSFFIPWHSVVIAAGSVFAVVFATMIYSTGKVKKDNPIDALRNENL